MKFICQQQELSKALNTVMKAVTTRTTMPILKQIYLKGEKNILKLICADTEVTIERHVKCVVEEEGELLVNAKNFNEIIKKLPKSDIIFSLKERNLMIESENSFFELPASSAEEFPQTTEMKEKKVFSLDSNMLKEMIRKVYFFTSTDESSGIYTGILVKITENELNFVGSDRYRLGICNESIRNEFSHELIIPSKSMIDIMKIINEEGIDEYISVEIGSNRVLFNIKNTKFLSRILEGHYINYSTLLNYESDVEVLVNRKNLLSAIDRASIFGKEGNTSIIYCDFDNNNLKISSFSEEGNAEENIRIEKTGEDIEMSFNSRYITDVLTAVEDENLKIFLNKRMCIIEPEVGKEFIFLISPLNKRTK